MARPSGNAHLSDNGRHKHSRQPSSRRHGEELAERARDEARPAEAVADAPPLEELRRARAELYSKTDEERRRREDAIRASYVSQSRRRHVETQRSSSSKAKGPSDGSERRPRHHAESVRRRRRVEEDDSDRVYVYSPRKEATPQGETRTTVRPCRQETFPSSENHNIANSSKDTMQSDLRDRRPRRRSTADRSVTDIRAATGQRQRTVPEPAEVYSSEQQRGPPNELRRAPTTRSHRADAPKFSRYDSASTLKGIIQSLTSSRSSSMRDPPVSSQTNARPSLRRSSTTTRARPSLSRPGSYTTATLPSVREMDDTATVATSRREKKRSSGLFAGLFGSNRPAPPERKVDCLTCGADDVSASKSAKLGCGHRMCHDCLKRIFEMSVTDPQHMPPKCCTDDHIPLRHVERLFDLKFKLMWNKKYQEYTTKNRTYCPSRGCGEWIKPSNIHMDPTAGRKYGKCSHCKTRVCVLCSGKWHNRKECPKDEELNKFVEIAKKSGWQKCFNCKAMVELKEGCNHMTCRCTAEFCMICGLKWKTCDCPWFTYETVEADRLNHMNVPEPIRILYRRVAGPPREAVYQAEMDSRREQERADEELARRLQALGTDDEDDEPRLHEGRFNMHNTAAHLMGDDFVRNATNILTAAFGQVRAVANQHLRSAPLDQGQGQRPPPLGPYEYQMRDEGNMQYPAAVGRRPSRGWNASSAPQPVAGHVEGNADISEDQPRTYRTVLRNSDTSNGLARVGSWLQDIGNDPADLRQQVVVGS